MVNFANQCDNLDPSRKYCGVTCVRGGLFQKHHSRTHHQVWITKLWTYQPYPCLPWPKNINTSLLFVLTHTRVYVRDIFFVTRRPFLRNVNQRYHLFSSSINTFSLFFHMEAEILKKDYRSRGWICTSCFNFGPHAIIKEKYFSAK